MERRVIMVPCYFYGRVGMTEKETDRRFTQAVVKVTGLQFWHVDL